MSGAEAPLVIGLIASIISIIDATKTIYDSAKDKHGLPGVFREVASRLPIVYDTLEATKMCIEKHPASGNSNGISSTIEACETRAKYLQEIFEKVTSSDTDSRADRYVKAVRTIGKGARVELLLKDILVDLQLIVGNHLVHMISNEEKKALATAVEELLDLEPSAPDGAISGNSNSFILSGGGHMLNATGGKNQYNLGGGNVFQGETLYFDQEGSHLHYHKHLPSSGSNDLELQREECRQEIPLTDPRDDRAEITSRFGSRVRGTCCWITRHDVYRAWWDNANSSLLWICGEPATGKTYLSIFLTTRLEGCTSNKECLAYYFCSRQDERRNTVLTMIRGLMDFLLNAQPELINGILQDYKRLKKHNGLFDMSNKEALWRNLMQMLRNTNLQRIYIVLDALDECDEASLSWVLPKLTSLTSLDSYFPTLKIIITSRQLPVAIHESLYMFPQILIGQSSNLERELQLFISFKLEKLADKKSNVEENAEKRALVRQKWLAATGHLMKLPTQTFLWVSFAIRDLEKSLLSEIEHKLQSLPRDLDGYYAQMLHQISLSGERQASVAARIIRWVVMALRPLSLLELSIATETFATRELNREEAMADLLRHCGYFLKVNQGFVFLIHSSAQEYLQGIDGKSASEHISHHFQVNEIEAHHEIARFCLNYIQGDGRAEGPFDDACRVNLTSFHTDTQTRKAKKFPFLQYAALHWPEHTRRSSRPEAILDLSNSFFRPESPKQQAWLHSYWHTNMSSWPLPDKSFDLFHLASFFGWSEIIRSLLADKGSLQDLFRARVNKKCNLDMSPLHWAVRNGHEETAKILLAYGADKSKGYGMPAMIWAVRNSHASIIRLLQADGFDIDSTGYGMTALHWAVWEEREEMVRLLVNLGASLTRRTSSLEFESAAKEVKDREFPWASSEEAKLIVRSTESEERKLFKKEGVRTSLIRLCGLYPMFSMVTTSFAMALFKSSPIVWESPALMALVSIIGTLGVRGFLTAMRHPAIGTFTWPSVALPLGCVLTLSALLVELSLWWAHGFAPGYFSPSLSPEATCHSHSSPFDILKKISVFLRILDFYRTILVVCSKVKNRWFCAYKPVFLPHMMAALLSINQQVYESTGCYMIELDHCVILAYLIEMGVCMIFYLGSNSPLGRTATELAVSKDLFEISRLLEEAT